VRDRDFVERILERTHVLKIAKFRASRQNYPPVRGVGAIGPRGYGGVTVGDGVVAIAREIRIISLVACCTVNFQLSSPSRRK